jgi:ribosomal protein S18 acetylase RimI-like enzyme
MAGARATRGAVAAFAIVARRGRRRQAVAEVLWAATSAAHRNRGIGTALIQHVVDELDFDIRLVEVKTLDPSAGYEPYCAILIAAIDGTL